ncbi:DUF721 domain-containing protein [Selenomonadales bacterium OttesenSCG-928-I06]|nr:DUF721 domain-containing protein [Selenomonadales bacterium OttesenSCG-928-I06]
MSDDINNKSKKNLDNHEFPLEDVIKKVFKKYGIKKKYNANVVLVSWDKIVGSQISENCFPVSIDKGILKLKVKNSAWSHHLMMMKKEVIQKINSYINENLVKDIFFSAGYYGEKKKYLIEDNIDNILENTIQPIVLNNSEIEEIKKSTKKLKDKKIKSKLDYIIIKQKALEKAKEANGWSKCLLCDTLVAPESKYCFNCNLNLNQNRSGKIEEFLIRKPYFSYKDLNRYFELSEEEYNIIKKSLFFKLLRILLTEDYKSDKEFEAIIVMLVSKNKVEDLNEKQISEVIDKLKKKFGKKEE